MLQQFAKTCESSVSFSSCVFMVVVEVNIRQPLLTWVFLAQSFQNLWG